MLDNMKKKISLMFPTFEYEQSVAVQDRIAVGVDEAGRGPLAGPVVAAAAWYRLTPLVFPVGEDRYTRLIRDSKTLSEDQREEVYQWIIDHFEIGVGIVDARTIDRVNILQATFLAMREAIAVLAGKRATKEKQETKTMHMLVDGNREIPELTFPQEAMVKGDARSVSIAAASIVAKVTRDRMMHKYDSEYLEYGFARHKGYGTAAHVEAIRRLGPCPIHRHSFAPVAELSREFARNKES
ncbi:MAG: ribonuclease HII [Candidatus Moraniibacteriota bacterium]|nr:MAG: ribonuclease HII [Candidatus Moranbacteria bacterium]